MEYSEVQRIARNTIEYIKGEIHSGMALPEVRRLCEEKMYELGADSFWYYDIGAFVFSGDETTVSVSGREYITSDRMIAADRKAMGEKGYKFLCENYTVENTYDAITSHVKP